ncbi:MAG: outer membrane lipoprotein carrier protein LolA [Bacillaceae bacterium]|nr:outer membrane lipoprotein carrier protein LolA [Bacillaceae bacterium]
MKKIISFILLGCLFLLVMAGCGEKTQEDVLEDLTKKLEEMTGYKANATMILETGNEPQGYEVEIWHKSPNYFRVALNTANKEQSQIILRNDEGVFVLTPALNKSFRFQSDWPENNSQVYLYESLINDILADPERVFTADEEFYVFQTKTNYTNKNLQQQEVTLNKKDLSPVAVKIMDVEQKALVSVEFEKFEFNPNFSDGDFDMDKNMTGAQLEIPVMAQNVEEPMSLMYPMYVPDGTVINDSKELKTEDGQRVVISYTGENNFTLIQQKSRVLPASTVVNVSQGEPVDLGFTVGALTTDQQTTSINWSHNGIDFFLASNDLSSEEMVSIARSVYGTEVK